MGRPRCSRTPSRYAAPSTFARRKSYQRARRLRHLLWIDSEAGLLAGAGMLALSAWLNDLYALPRSLLAAMGVANLAYGTDWTARAPGAPPA